jgi:hypothetical protein
MTVSRGLGGVGGGGVAGAPSRIGWRVTATESRLVSRKCQTIQVIDTENEPAVEKESSGVAGSLSQAGLGGSNCKRRKAPLLNTIAVL